MTMNTSYDFARNIKAKSNSQFSNNPAQFIGVYLKRKFAEAALQNVIPNKSYVSAPKMVCKWVRDPATGHMECFWKKINADIEVAYA